MLRRNALQFLLLILIGLSPAIQSPAMTQVPPTSALRPSVERLGPHGGAIHTGQGWRCEFVVTAESLCVYVFDADGNALPTRELRGRVSFKKNSHSRIYRYDLYPEASTGNSLYLPINRSLTSKKVKVVEVTLYGLSLPLRRPVHFTAAFQRSLTPRQIAIKRQRTCPVSGKRLGSMGQPIQVTLPQRDVFVCCKNCVRKLQQAPESYLGNTVRKERTIRSSIR